MQSAYKKNKNYYILPILFIIGIVPLIVSLKIVPLKGLSYDYFNGKSTNYDFFSYYKMLFLLIFSFLSLATFLLKLYRDNNVKNIKKMNIYIPILTYITCAIISTIVSKYKPISISGFPDRYEGIYTIISYSLVLLFTINLVNNKQDIKVIVYFLLISSSIIGVIGIFQYLGMDFFKSNLGRKIMVGSHQNLSKSISFSLDGNFIYSTLYHYNYVGSYMAMTFPLSFILFVFCKNKIVLGSVMLVSFINWIACGSRAGIIGGIISIIVIVIILRKKIFTNWKKLILILITLLAVFVFINKFSGDFITSRIKLMFNNEKNINNQNYAIKNIKINGKELILIDTNGGLKVILDNNDLKFSDINGRNIMIHYDKDSKKGVFLTEKLKDYYFNVGKVNNTSVFQLVNEKSNITLRFAITNSGFKYVTNTGKIIEPKPVEHIGFEGKETLGSARGYIWSRSLPLIKGAPLFGYGPDTFAIVFPQYDYVGKYKAYGTTQMLVDKPHNLYLQTAINTGLISLIAMLAIFVMYIGWSFKLFIKNDFNDFYSITGLAVFVAIIGYLGAGFFNDSVVSVAPVFWILLGLGISINYTLTHKSDEKKV